MTNKQTYTDKQINRKNDFKQRLFNIFKKKIYFGKLEINKIYFIILKN